MHDGGYLPLDIIIPANWENDMLSTLLLVLFVLMLVHAGRVSLASVQWSFDPGRALSVLVAILLILAFAIGFIDF